MSVRCQFYGKLFILDNMRLIFPVALTQLSPHLSSSVMAVVRQRDAVMCTSTNHDMYSQQRMHGHFLVYQKYKAINSTGIPNRLGRISLRLTQHQLVILRITSKTLNKAPIIPLPMCCRYDGFDIFYNELVSCAAGRISSHVISLYGGYRAAEIHLSNSQVLWLL